MMASLNLSLVIPAFNEVGSILETLTDLSSFLRSSALSYEILVVDDGSTDATRSIVESAMVGDRAIRLLTLPSNQGKGAAVRRGVLESKGEVVAFIDADLPYELQNLATAIALVQSESCDLAIGARDLPQSQRDPSYPALRRTMGRAFSSVIRLFLAQRIFDTQCGLKVLTSTAAKVLFCESRLDGFGFDFEILFLANKYGFRIERIPVAMTHRHESKVRLVRDSWQMLVDIFRVRRFDRLMSYRPARRCPVCFSSDVWSRTQIRGSVVRECRRCKCRYLNTFPPEEELERLYNDAYFESGRDTELGYVTGDETPATRRTNERRLARLRRLLPARARVLEVGAGTGIFGAIASWELDYVGIDLSESAARTARQKNLDVYCSSLKSFVNTGAMFDAITMFHVFEHFPDPHDALARVLELLKPGGFLVMITPDTESFLCLVSGDRWVSYKIPEHLILYSRSALIELLEHSGFEIVSAGADFEYCSHPFLFSRLDQLSSRISGIAQAIAGLLPDPLPVTSGSIRIVAKRRAGPPVNTRTIRIVEATHAR